MFFGIWLILLGILGAASLIVAKKPNAAELIGKLAPYQGWFGIASIVGGVLALINALTLLSMSFILAIITLITAVVLIGLGFLLGIGVLKTFIKDPKAQEKMDQTALKLAPYRGTLGIVAIVLGVVCIVGNLIWAVGVAAAAVAS